MLINQIKMPLDSTFEDLKNKALILSEIASKDVKTFNIVKKSIDARNKSNVHFSYSVEISKETKKIRTSLQMNRLDLKNKTRPLVVGSGPCGLFAALVLAKSGTSPIILERGQDIDKRKQAVKDFWENGKLNPNSNVQFGEGGAGTFSDGKLTTGINDPRCRSVLETFVECGAPDEILFLAKPHIGTDKLHTTIKNLRNAIIKLGGEFRFESNLDKIIVENSSISGAQISNSKNELYIINTDAILLCIGHSARDTLRMLYKNGVTMEQKAFSVGVRIEHSQDMINFSQYGVFSSHPAVGAADYKLAIHLPNGRSVYTFCMCPGGTVVASASQPEQVVTNGMSLYSRDGANANSALLVNVTPSDFENTSPLAGIEFQHKWEKIAFKAGGSNYFAPAQLVSDFLNNKPSVSFGSILPTYLPGVRLTALDSCLPSFVISSLQQAILEMDKKLKGFASPDALLTGIETRSSSPVRIVRNDKKQSNITGLYPCGEGAGYSGGIVSAAVDGIKSAEEYLKTIMF